MNDTVLYEMRGAIAILTLNRPEQRNAVNIELTQTLRRALARFEADPEARIAILTGAGNVFSAGMDLRAFLEGDGESILGGDGHFAGFVRASRTKPVIAAVNGPALAGGCELALACDLIVASETAFFGLPEPAIGIFAGAGGPFRLARKIPPGKAMELCLTGDRLSAQEAHGYGMVNCLAAPDAVLDAAVALADRILRNAPLSIAATLELMRAANDLAERELWALNQRLWADVVASDDAREGPSAFVQKRPPEWGRGGSGS
ncbi:crotonase/enoyl-CoA hydratase family protein [Microbulbifer sp. S227A]|uniref:crotonase/enoyl-CoA hydratase family protein n=1 Tax=Microbulbifer sp. S227A TaxID=3415131 RepID=UPI003C7D0B1E